MRIRKADLPDIAIWGLIGFYTLVAHWIWFYRGIQETVIIVLAAAVIVSRASFKIKTTQAVMFFAVLALAVETTLTTLKAVSTNYFMQDIKPMLGCFLVFCYLFQFRQMKYDKFEQFSEMMLKILNWYTAFNHVIIIIQSRVPYFLMNRSAVESVNNSLYFDQLTGFLGVNGTTRWSMITTLVIVFNFLEVIKRKNQSKSKKRLIYYNIGLVAVSMYIAALNSARAFFILMPLTLILFFVYAVSLNWNRKLKTFIAVSVVLVIFFMFYMYNSSVRNYVNDLIEDKFNVYWSWNIDTMIAANDDRAIAVDFALRNGGLFGVGIGYVPMHSSNDEVTYLGLNSVSSYVYMIGTVGYLLYVFTLSLIVISRKDNNWSKIIVFPAYIIVVSYLLPVFSSVVLIFSLGCILATLDRKS